MEAKDVRFKILINNSETQLIKTRGRDTTPRPPPTFFSKIILNFSFKIDSITLDPDPNWAKILDPDPNSMYLDPQHCFLTISHE